MSKFTKADIPYLRASNKNMAKWSDSKVLRVCNRARRKQEKALRKKKK